jgi:hypothetical protein
MNTTKHVAPLYTLLELGLIVPILNLVNIRFGLKDPGLDLHWDIIMHTSHPPKIEVFTMLVVAEELKH